MKQPIKSPARQQGAILIMTAAFIVAAVSLLALAVDTGRLYAAQAKLQSATNLAALDASRAISACGIGEPAVPQTAANDAVDKSIDNNFGDKKTITKDVTLGQRNKNKNLFEFTNSDQFAADAVKVKLQRSAPTSLLGGTSNQPLTATAGAFDKPVAGISIGSSLLTAGKTGLLAALLAPEGQTAVTVVSTEGLANAKLSLGDLLKADANVGSLKDLLDADLTLPAQLNLLATALDNTVGAVNNTAAATLTDLANLADPKKTSKLGEVLNIEPGVEKLVSALPINVAGLLSAIAQAANKGTPATLPVDVDLGGLAKAKATINIIQPPQIGFGRAGRDGKNNYRTTATTAQVAIQLNITLLDVLPKLLEDPLLNLPIYVKVASAHATLDDIVCAGLSKPVAYTPPKFEHTVIVGANTEIARLGIGNFVDISAAAPVVPDPSQTVPILNVAKVAQVDVNGGLQVSLGSKATPDLDPFDGPFPPQEDGEIRTQSVGTDLSEALNGNAETETGLAGLSKQLNAGNLDVKLFDAGVLGEIFDGLDGLLGGVLGNILDGLLNDLLGGILGIGNPDGDDLLDLVIDVLKPVLSLVDDDLLEPLFKSLGLSLGNADVSINSVEANQPQLFCTGKDCFPPNGKGN